MRANFRQMESWFIDPRVERDLRELNQQQTAWGGELRPQALWLTCRDKIVDRFVERVSTLEGAFVLRRSCDDDLGGGSLQRWPVQVIAHAIQVLHVSEIVICGHSGCEATHARRTPDRALVPQGSEPIFRRVQRHLQRIKHGQEFVIDQLASLHEMPAVRQAIAVGRLTLQGAFYIAESGAYLRYDAVSRAFRPIDGASPSTG